MHYLYFEMKKCILAYAGMEIRMVFHKIAMDDREWLECKFREDGKMLCEFCFANSYLWRNAYPTQLSQLHDCAVMRYLNEDEISYVFPIGNGDKKRAVEEIIMYEQMKGRSLTLTGMTMEEASLLVKWFPGRFRVESDRDYEDYIYLKEDLANLSGKRYHGKRNHIARFMDEDNWNYEPLSEGNVEDCIEMNMKWRRRNIERWDDLMQEEYDVAREALKHYKELELIGGVLKKAGEVVAFTIGEPLTKDTFVVHFEKAYPDVRGAYPMINQQFVKAECQQYKYINREEDNGEEGLRKAKLSYHPAFLLKKYTARQN